MSDGPTLERRQARRVNVAVTVELQSNDGFSMHATRDLSRGGAFFDRAIPFEVGSHVEVALHLPGEEAIRCRGEIINVPEPKSFGMAVRFLDLSHEAEGRIAAFIGSSS